jgi:hypothetical protein
VLIKTLAALSGALLMTAAGMAPAMAQEMNDWGPRPTGTDTPNAPAERVAPSRMDGVRRAPARQQAAPAAPTPEEITAAAQQQATLANTDCQVTESRLLGTTAENTSVYEVACAAGPGYMIESKTPPSATDCVVLAHSADQLRASDPAADVGPQCTLTANTDTQKFLREYAQQAGVPCTVDQAKVLGTANDGAVIYEIGCTDMAGYWIRKTGDAWSKTDCLQVVAESGTCAFTTQAENAALLKSWLAGSEAANCDVTEVRLMGQNANGMFYEAKCAGADGVIARLNAEHAVQQIYPCATAQQIGGGCTLTPAPATAPATTEQQ